MSKLNYGNKYGAVVDLCIHMPSTDEQLKEETNTVATNNGADKSMVKVSAVRIPAKYSKPIISVTGKIRNACEEHAMHINGQYVVPPTEIEALWMKLYGHTDLTNKEPTGGLIGQFYTYVAVLKAACMDGTLVEELKKLGDLASQVQVLDCNEVISKFGVDVDVDIDVESPHVAAILSKMDKDVVKRLGERVEADAAKRYNASITEITGQIGSWIRKVLGDIVKRGATDGKGVHFKSLVGNIKDLVERLPSYNVTNDSKVTNVYNEIYKTFSTVEKDDFKDDDRRKALTDKANDILAMFDAVPAATPTEEVAVEAKVEPNAMPDVLVGLVK